VDPQLIAPDETINSIAAQRLLLCKLPVDSTTKQKQVLPNLKLKRDLVTLKSLGLLKKEQKPAIPKEGRAARLRAQEDTSNLELARAKQMRDHWCKQY
jgi:hypothetical protein